MLCNYDNENRLDFTTIHPKVLEDIALAEALADVVIVCPHWGTEYTTKPSSYQQKFAKQMTEAGADIIIGTHPHVVQPMEWIEADNDNIALCYYSLGNYVSTQKDPLCMLEAMAWVNIHVVGDEVTVSEENTGVIPMICHYTANPVRLKQVYLLEDYTVEQADSHGIKIYGEVDFVLSDLQTLCGEVFGTNILSADDILTP
jgi:poly-gamma-glutamate synthesis protein (capsule biosynthesis protein)